MGGLGVQILQHGSPIRIVSFECGHMRGCTQAMAVPDVIPTIVPREAHEVFDDWGEIEYSGEFIKVLVRPSSFLSLATRCMTLAISDDWVLANFGPGSTHPCPPALFLKRINPADRTSDAFVGEHEGRHRALYVDGLGYKFMTITVHRRNDEMQAHPSMFANQDSVVYKEGRPQSISGGAVWATMIEGVGGALPLLQLTGEVPSEILPVQTPTPTVGIGTPTRTVSHSSPSSGQTDMQGPEWNAILSPFGAPGHTPPDQNARSLICTDGLVEWGGNQYIVTSTPCPVPFVSVMYAAMLLRSVRPSVQLFAGNEKVPMILMLNVHQLRTTEGAHDGGLASHCPPASGPVDCCLGRRLLSNWGHILNDTFPHMCIFSDINFALLCGVMPNTANVHALAEVTRQLQECPAATHHIFVVFVPRDSVYMGTAVPTQTAGRAPFSPDGHWCLVSVFPYGKHSTTRCELFWPGDGEECAPRVLVDALQAGLALVYGTPSGTATELHDVRAIALAQGGGSAALQQTTRYDCGTICALSQLCLCKGVDPLVSQGDLVVNQFRGYMVLCFVSQQILPSMDGWLEQRASHTPATCHSGTESLQSRSNGLCSPLTIGQAPPVSPRTVKRGVNGKGRKCGKGEVDTSGDVQDWIQCFLCSKWRKVTADECRKFAMTDWHCGFSITYQGCETVEEHDSDDDGDPPSVATRPAHEVAPLVWADNLGGMPPASQGGVPQPEVGGVKLQPTSSMLMYQLFRGPGHQPGTAMAAPGLKMLSDLIARDNGREGRQPGSVPTIALPYRKRKFESLADDRA
jgi:hypothetical protein